MKNLDQDKLIAGRSILEILNRFEKKLKIQDLLVMENKL